MKKVLVFGVFDKLHPGHLHFFEQARALGDELVVVVARDAMVEVLKKKRPRDSEAVRMKALMEAKNVSQVKLGDEKVGMYAIVKQEKPDIIALGYDQQGLLKDLEEKITAGFLPEIPLVSLLSHKPEMYKSSLL